MRHHWSSYLAILVFSFTLTLAAGCGDEDRSTNPDPPPIGERPNLSDPTGGLAYSDEEPAFGDAMLEESAAAEVVEDDPAFDDPMVTEIEAGREPHGRIFALTLLWGKLERPTREGSARERDGDQYDWSGSLRLSRGTLVLRSTVSFERPSDHIVRPRENNRELAWVSHTADGFDGLRVALYHRAQGFENDSLTIDLGLYRAVFSLGDLVRLDSLVTVDEAGNKVHLIAYRTEPGGERAGFLRGRWSPIAEGDSLGDFRGVWVSERGGANGFVRGHYGTNRDGEKVFFGKYIGQNGAIRGLLRGSWDVRESEMGAAHGEYGWFRGVWLGRNREELGQLRGRWGVLRDSLGFFEGRWCRGCGMNDEG